MAMSARWRAVLGACMGLGLAPHAQAQPLPPDLALVEHASGLTQPLGVRHAGDDSARLFTIGKSGVIEIVPPGSSTPLSTPFLRLAGAGSTPPPGGFRSEFENGLLGLAFHPQYAANGYFYIHYNDANDDTVIARYRVSATDPNRADASTVQVLLRMDQGSNIHKGGDLAFGPDGFLYIAMGDGANQGDPCDRAQTLNPTQLAAADGVNGECPVDTNFANSGGNPDSRALLGKVLRIDVDTPTPPGDNFLCGTLGDGSAPYSIPPTNPYAGSAGNDNCEEIWSYGWRNPWRFSFDRATGDMLLGDVGFNRMEEISLDPATSVGGSDFGWDNCEGTLPLEGTCSGSVAPIYAYPRSAGFGSSVTGGYVYRGDVTLLQGLYIWGDYTTGRIFFLRPPAMAGGSWTNTPWLDTTIALVGFGEDQAGEVYVADIATGKVFKISSSQTSLIFFTGFEN
jgi:glucose/arabinose dehydrogenase